MPIRFRCAYCSQLMGIARRKAGTVVSCPTCHGQVVVPNPGPGEDEPERPPSGANAAPPLFERSDFDEVFGTAPQAPAPAPVPARRSPAPAAMAPSPAPPVVAPSASQPAPAPPAAPVSAPAAGWEGTQAEVNFDVERIPGPALTAPVRAGQAGVWLSPTTLTLLSLVVVVLLALAFVGGLLVGRSLGG